MISPKRLLILIFILECSIQVSEAQIGLSAGYKSLNPPGWRDNFKRYSITNPYPMDSWQIGLDFHLFGSKTKRIEFYPELFFSKFKGRDSTTNILGSSHIEHLQFGFEFNTRVYPFDIDCNFGCDTINTKEAFLRKSFFVEASPVLIYRINSQYWFNRFGRKGISKTFTSGVCFGVGLDLHFSERFILTPVFQFFYFPDYSRWGDGRSGALNIKTDLRQMFIGCRTQVDF